MSKDSDFIVQRLLLVVCMALTAECSNHTVSSHYAMPGSSSYYFIHESTLIYYDMSTEHITPTSTSSARSSVIMSSLLTATPPSPTSSFVPSPTASVTPSPTASVTPSLPDIEEMESNAIVMTFSEIDLEQWRQIENTFLSIIAAECTRRCASSGVDCGTTNNVSYTSDDVVILPGYPKIVDGELSVAFSVSLPSGAVLSDGDQPPVINQNALLDIASGAIGAVRDGTGTQVEMVGRYTAPASAAAADSSKSKANLALILPLTLIPTLLFLSVAVGLGSFYVWKLKKKNKSLDLINQSVTTEQVELMSYKTTFL